jgi:hypothetical protein
MQINLSNDRFPFQYRGKKITITQADLFVMLSDSGTGSALSGFSHSAQGPPNSAPNPVKVVLVNPVGSAPHYSTSGPLLPLAPAPGAPIGWSLQYSGDLSQVAITDIFLLCEFSAASLRRRTRVACGAKAAIRLQLCDYEASPPWCRKSG